MFGVAVANWKITENIDNGSKFISLELNQICNRYAIYILRQNKNSNLSLNALKIQKLILNKYSQ